MYTFFKSRFHFSYHSVLVISVVLLLLFSTANIIMAAPISGDPDKVAMFLSYDLMNSGSNKDQTIGSYNGLDFGASIPFGYGNLGFKTSVNSNSNYSYYEVFSNWIALNNTLMDLTLEHLDKDGNILRFGLSRPLPLDTEDFMIFLGPGLSWFQGDNNNSVSLFLQTKINYHIAEGIHIDGAWLYDFNLNNSQCSLSLGFTY
jgi:hypothetical protein